jgi:hypothetical protein
VKRLKKATGPVANPFDKGTPRFKVAALLMRKGPHSFDELVDAAGGTLSPRTLAAIIVGLEEAGLRFNRYRHAEWGMTYELDPDAALIGKHDGADATGMHVPKSAATKKAPAKKAAKSTKAAPVKKTEAKKGTKTPTTRGAATKTTKKAVSKKVATKKKVAPAKARPRRR